jgi:hypothetical protein
MRFFLDNQIVLSAEDRRLTEIVQQCGSKNWAFIVREMLGRNPYSYCERSTNYINPVLDTTPLSPAEDDLLDEKFSEHGPDSRSL